MRDTKARVGVFHPYPGRMGGSQQVTLALVRNLPEFGYHPVVIAPGEGVFVEAARRSGVEVRICVPGPRWQVEGTGARPGKWLSFATAVQLARYWRVLRDVVDASGISLLDCADVRGVIMAAPAARMAGMPGVWHVHGVPRGASMRMLGPVLAAASGHLLLVSQAAADYWKLPRWMLGSSAIVHNGLEPPDPPGTAERGEPGTLLVAGSLSAVKGQDILIRAMPEILRQCPGARCLVAGKDWGDGRFAMQLEKLVDEYGLHSSVEFLGQRQDIPKLIERSACVVVPSRMETFGMIALEAMALSRPVVASRTGGLSEIVEDGATGFLATAEDPHSLAQAILRLLEDPVTASDMGRRGHERWLGEFTARRMAERTARFYDRLLGNRTRST